MNDLLLERQIRLVSGRAPPRAASPIPNCRGNRDGKTVARPHRGVPSPRGTQPHVPDVPDVFSLFYKKK